MLRIPPGMEQNESRFFYQGEIKTRSAGELILAMLEKLHLP